MRLILEYGGKRKLREWEGGRLRDLVAVAQGIWPDLAGQWVSLSVQGALLETDADVILRGDDVVHVARSRRVDPQRRC